MSRSIFVRDIVPGEEREQTKNPGPRDFRVQYSPKVEQGVKNIIGIMPQLKQSRFRLETIGFTSVSRATDRGVDIMIKCHRGRCFLE
jgi:hypothetical protein